MKLLLSFVPPGACGRHCCGPGCLVSPEGVEGVRGPMPRAGLAHAPQPESLSLTPPPPACVGLSKQEWTCWLSPAGWPLGGVAFLTLSSLGKAHGCLGGQGVLQQGPLHPTPLLEAPHSVLVFSLLLVPAPSAPVINPQAPNSATGSSVRVCWSLYSDDTVESYLLSYRPVQDGSPGKDQAGETLPRSHARSGTAKGPQRPGSSSDCFPSNREGRGGMNLHIQLLGDVMIWELPGTWDAGK